jgi:cystathionine beta-lyase/cystathionine gamma-synthase
MSKRPETEVIHVAEGAREGAVPLTTPIYATSTFLFANAAEMLGMGIAIGRVWRPDSRACC